LDRRGAEVQLRVVLDGVEQLTDLLVRRAGYPSVVAAVAEHAVFLDPETVAQTDGAALFSTIRMRNVSERGSIHEVNGRRVLLDDNTSPTDAFLWAAGIERGKVREMQFNHVWAVSHDPDAYTALWNICATPAFLAKTTDGSNHPEVVAALRFRAYRLYGVMPAGTPRPKEPAGYRELRWAPHPAAVSDLAGTLTARLRRTQGVAPQRRAARSAGSSASGSPTQRCSSAGSPARHRLSALAGGVRCP
jgi:hypothetical protein